MNIHLTDICYGTELAQEFTGTTEQIITYLDKDVRGSLRPTDPARAHVDAAIAALRAGDLDTADRSSSQLGVTLHTPEVEAAIKGTVDLREDQP